MKAEEIENLEKKLERWLAAVPHGSRVAFTAQIANRCSMRVLPLLGSVNIPDVEEQKEFVASCLKLNLLSRCAPDLPRGFDLALPGIAASPLNYRSDSDVPQFVVVAAVEALNASLAGNRQLYVQADRAVLGAYDAAETASEGAYRLIGLSRPKFLRGTVSAQIRNDTRWFTLLASEFSARTLRGGPLWLVRPSWWSRVCTNFQDLLRSPPWKVDGWPIWLEWYEPIIEGKPAFDLPRATADALERDIALGSRNGTFNEAFWKREPREINAEIAEWVDEARAKEVRGVPSGAVPEAEPLNDDELLSLPASIETIGRRGKVELVRARPEADVSDSILRSVSQDLGRALRELAAEADAAQADRRFVAFLREAAASIELSSEKQERLFESGRNHLTLEHYASVVDEEWNPLLAGKFHALLIQFGNTLQKFPAWRAFKEEPPRPVEPVEATEFEASANELLAALEGNRQAVDPPVFEKWRFLASRFRDVVNRSQLDAADAPHWSQGAELLQSDYAVSLANIVTSYAEAILVRYANALVGWTVNVVALMTVMGVVALLAKKYPSLFNRAVKALAAAKRIRDQVDV